MEVAIDAFDDSEPDLLPAGRSLYEELREMWQKFTERARRIVFFAQEEASRLGENYVSTEHMLLGLIREPDNVACRVMIEILGVDVEQIRTEIMRNLTRGDGRLGQDMQLTPLAKHVIDLADEEARGLGNSYIGTEHLLLGLIRERDGLAGRALAKAGVDLHAVRYAVARLQAGEGKAAARGPVGSSQDEELRKMWQRFTERARRVVFFAQEEAGRLGENYVSTEHIILALVRETDNVACRVLINVLGVDVERIRSEIQRQVTRGVGQLGQDMQLTPRAKRVIDLAYDEARLLRNDYIGTEHLLLGLIREGEGLAGRVLAKLGVELIRTRDAVEGLQASEGKAPAGAAVPNPARSLQNEASRDMWQKFTRRAREAVFFAQEEAAMLGETYVSTEALLLGLLREPDNVASRVLARTSGISAEQVRAEIERRVGPRTNPAEQAMLMTPRTKRVIDLSYDEARRLHNKYIGTEHLLLGMIREGEGMAGLVLTKLGADLEGLRDAINELQENDTAAPGDIRSPNRSPKTTLQDDRRTGPQRAADIIRLVNDTACWAGKSLVSLADVSAEQFNTVLEAARAFKILDHDRTSIVQWNYPRTLAMIFEKPSLRTRVSFEAGMAHLGGHAIYLAPSDIGLGSREPVGDVALALSRWVDVISARVFKHETVVELAAHATVPVINALSDQEHPVQAFADLLTLEAHKGPIGKGLKLAYIGDGNNVLHALLLACAKMGVNLSAACPEGYSPADEYVELARDAARETGAEIVIGTDAATAAENADCLYTDVWTSMGQEVEQAARLRAFAAYQINEALLAKAKPDAIVLHCLPAHAGEEISAEVYAKHRDIIMDQAENRLHTQKALIALMLGI